VLDDKYVLQEARGDLSLHPSYRRYHYGYGPLAVVDSGTSRFISTDALGSTTDLTTGTGTVAAGHQYDAWGQYRNGSAPSASEPKLGFTGHQFDPETGLVYARARYYDPEVGIFISRDAYEGELSDGPSLHRFAYAYGNPLLYVDEDGNVAYEVADEWERRQREAAWTAEEGMEGAARDGASFANWAASKLGDNWFARSVGAVGVVTVQSLIQVTGSLGAIIGDPTGLVRMPMRLGTGTAQGVEDIQNGKYFEGGLKIVAEGTQVVDLAVGGFGAVRSLPGIRSGIAAEMESAVARRAALEESAARKSSAAERIVQEVKSARASESTARVAVRDAFSESQASTSRLLEKHWDDVQTLKAIGEARTPAGVARLAERAANEPGFMVGMEDGAGGGGPSAGKRSAHGSASPVPPVATQGGPRAPTFADFMTPDEAVRYNNYWTRHAPEQSSPYDMLRRYAENGDVKQVTTYDEFGTRHRQYDLRDARRGEHQHNFEYSPKTPRPKGKRSGHLRISE
jgi:RHS repeat-associated protein